MRSLSTHTGLFFLSLMLFVSACQSSSKNEKDEPPDNGHSDIPELAALSEQIGAHPQNPELYFNRADIYATTGNYAKAIADLEKAISLDSSIAYVHVRLSDIYLLEHDKTIPLPDSRKAISVLQDYLEQFPDNELANFELAATYTYVKKYSEAIQRLEKVLSLNAFNPEAYFQLGLNHKYLGDTTKAISLYMKATEQDPDHYDAFMQLGLLFSSRGNDMATDYFQNALRIDQESTEALYGIARFYQQKHHYKEAIEWYRKLIFVDTQYEQAYYNLGFIYYELDSIQSAYNNFVRAISVQPDYAAAYFGRGFMAEEMGRPEEARTCYLQALKLDPENEVYIRSLEELKQEND